MIDLVRILEAVPAVPAGAKAAGTAAAQAGRGVPAVPAVPARIVELAQEIGQTHPESHPGAGTNRATCIYNRDSRDNRDTNNDAGSRVPAGDSRAGTAGTTPRFRVWRVTLGEGTRLVMIRPAGGSLANMTEAAAHVYGGRVAKIEPDPASEVAP